MKGKSILIIVIALAAIYPIATGDFRLIGLKYRVLALAAGLFNALYISLYLAR